MTMETWWLGFYMNRWRFILFILVSMMWLIGLAYYRGFREDLNWRDAVIDAFVGYAVGVVTGALFLTLFGVIRWGMPADEIIGKIALQATSSAIGALLARAQLGGGKDEEKPEEENGRSQHYWAEIFLMMVGALFISYTVAPTEEIILIAYQITPWHALIAVFISLLILHVFVYKVDFHGQEQAPEGSTPFSLFMHFTVVGYLVVFLTSLYILWSFGRIDGVEPPMIFMYGAVLSVPGALGAAAARLIL
jgi:putative integral membrane protein (TIGR02587 family)